MLLRTVEKPKNLGERICGWRRGWWGRVGAEGAMQVRTRREGLASLPRSQSLCQTWRGHNRLSRSVGGQADKTWQLTGYEEVEKKEEWNKE